MGAMLDEMSCLTRDFFDLKTAPKEGINMLSGVASDNDVQSLSKRFSVGELTRMLDLIQKTAAGFSRSSSRRMDAELCILNLCKPELVLDAEALNSRITRLEDRINSGMIQVSVPQAAPIQNQAEEEFPPMPDDQDAPPCLEQMDTEETVNEAPTGFWSDLTAQIRKEIKIPTIAGFFSDSPNAPIHGILNGSVLSVVCDNEFSMEMINKKEVLEILTMKASAKMGHPIQVKLVDKSKGPVKTSQMESLLQFGRDHSDIVKIKDNY